MDTKSDPVKRQKGSRTLECKSERSPGACKCDRRSASPGNHCTECGGRLHFETERTGESVGKLRAVATLSEKASDYECQAEQTLLPLVRPCAPEEVAATQDQCSCGRELRPDAKFCDGCGAPVGHCGGTFVFVGLTPGIKDLRVRIPVDDLIIGKGSDCQLALDGDEYISRQHARVFHDQGAIFIEDLGSRNGTFLRVRRPIVLNVGDELAFGTSVMRLEDINSNC
jgi:hypothetical protein